MLKNLLRIQKNIYLDCFKYEIERKGTYNLMRFEELNETFVDDFYYLKTYLKNI